MLVCSCDGLWTGALAPCRAGQMGSFVHITPGALRRSPSSGHGFGTAARWGSCAGELGVLRASHAPAPFPSAQIHGCWGCWCRIALVSHCFKRQNLKRRGGGAGFVLSWCFVYVFLTEAIK